MIAEKLQTVSDRSQRAAIEVALFGKAGAKLDNLLSGSQGALTNCRMRPKGSASS
jgi:hypothetical protein